MAAKCSSQEITQGSETLTVNPLLTSLDPNEHFATSAQILARNILPSTQQSPVEIKGQVNGYRRTVRGRHLQGGNEDHP